MQMHFQHLFGEGIVEQSGVSNRPGVLFVSANIALDRSSIDYDGLKVERLTSDMTHFASRNNFVALLSQGEVRVLH